MLEPEEEAVQDIEEERTRNYFGIQEKDIDEILQSQSENLGGGDDDALSPFQKKASEMEDIFDNGEIKKRILKQGLESDGLPPPRSAVTLHYSCSVEDQDEPYDSTYMRGKAERLRLGIGSLLPGLEIAVSSMKKLEKSEFLIGPTLAYGDLGCPPRIPKKAHILARIELLDFVEEGEAEALLAIPPEERNRQYNFDQILEVVRKVHKEGNNHAKSGEHKLAARW